LKTIITFYNADFMPLASLARAIAVDLAIMPRAETELERQVIRMLEEYHELDFVSMLRLTMASESALIRTLGSLKGKKVIDWFVVVE
jgi:hypothetical protein